jgi:superfamily II DNA or RNA helicase
MSKKNLRVLNKKIEEDVDDVSKLDTVLNKAGYIVRKKGMSVQQIVQLRKDLTVQPITIDDYKPKWQRKPITFPVYQETETEFNVPKYYGLEKYGYPKKDRLSTESRKYKKIDITFNVELRPYQKDIMKDLLEGLKTHGGGILTMGCGRGKTNMAIHVISQLKLKTLLVVHKEFLKNQIIDRIENSTNIEELGGFGYIQGKTLDTDHAIVIATVQSLSQKDYDPEIFKEFGLVVIDECHHMGGKSFFKAFHKINSPYMLGLTATPRRNDGMFKLIHWFMGPQLYYEEQPPNPNVRCKFINFQADKDNKNFQELIIKASGKPNRSKMITNLANIKSRNSIILKILEKLLVEKNKKKYKRTGRKILVLSGRVDHLKLIKYKLDVLIKSKLNDLCNEDIKTGLYIGELKEKELEISAKADVVFGSYQMAEEGLDIEDLNAVILATPKSDIQQSIGRILRKQADDYEEYPLIIDFADKLQTFTSQKTKRKKYYKGKYYQIKDYNVTSDDVASDDFENIIEELLKIHYNEVSEKLDKYNIKKDNIKKYKKLDTNICLFDD